MITYGENEEKNLNEIVVRGMTNIRSKTRDGRLYASQSGQCERKTALTSTQVGNEVITASMNAYFKIGETIEELILDSLFDQGILLFKQYRLPDIGINMGGYVDGIIFVDGQVKVLEIKSCGTVPNKPKPDHLAQTLIYSAITGLPAQIMYMSRQPADFYGNMNIETFDIETSTENLSKAVWSAVYGYLAVGMGVLPDRPPHMKKSYCGFCPGFNDCWKTGPKNEIKGLKSPTSDQHAELVESTSKFVEAILNPVATKDRRIGVLNFLSRNGTRYAKNLLESSDWSNFGF